MKHMSQGASSIYEVITHNPEGPERTSWRRDARGFHGRREMGWGSSMSSVENYQKPRMEEQALRHHCKWARQGQQVQVCECVATEARLYPVGSQWWFLRKGAAWANFYFKKITRNSWKDELKIIETGKLVRWQLQLLFPLADDQVDPDSRADHGKEVCLIQNIL